MGVDYWHLAWVCPFYKWSDKARVFCEGGTAVTFANVETIKTYMVRYCAGHDWKRCTIARALLEQYEKEDDNEGK